MPRRLATVLLALLFLLADKVDPPHACQHCSELSLKDPTNDGVGAENGDDLIPIHYVTIIVEYTTDRYQLSSKSITWMVSVLALGLRQSVQLTPPQRLDCLLELLVALEELHHHAFLLLQQAVQLLYILLQGFGFAEVVRILLVLQCLVGSEQPSLILLNHEPNILLFFFHHLFQPDHQFLLLLESFFKNRNFFLKGLNFHSVFVSRKFAFQFVNSHFQLIVLFRQLGVLEEELVAFTSFLLGKGSQMRKLHLALVRCRDRGGCRGRRFDYAILHHQRRNQVLHVRDFREVHLVLLQTLEKNISIPHSKVILFPQIIRMALGTAATASVAPLRVWRAPS